MNSKDLVKSALNREYVDRVPFYPPFQGYWAMEAAGITTADSFRNPKLVADIQCSALESYRIDGAEVMWDWLLPVEALGCEVKIPEFGTIPTLTHVINSRSDLDKLPEPDFEHFYRYVATKDTASLMSERMGKDRYFSASLLSPYTLAGELRGAENMMMDCFMDPDFVHDLVKVTTEIEIGLIEMICSWDIDAVMICDPTASGDMISRDDYATFSQTSTKVVGDKIRKEGKDFIVHICGDTSDRLDVVADSGCIAFSVDYQVDVGEAVKNVGDRIAIIGNVNPTADIYSGTPESVREAASNILRKGGKKGFLLGSGCDIPVGSPGENVMAMSEAIDSF